MPGTFNRLPIRSKLNFIILLACTVSLVLMAVVAMLSQYYMVRKHLESEMQTLARIIAQNSQAGLAFRDQNFLHDILASLAAKPTILSATISTSDDEVFVVFEQNGGSAQLAQLSIPSRTSAESMRVRLSAGYASFYEPIMLDDKQIGLLAVHASLAEMRKNMIFIGGLTIISVAVGLLVAMLLSNRLLGVIAVPILSLSKAMEQVSESKDYNLRVEVFNEDELGQLAMGFNEMLGKIEARDEYLEEQVALRTKDLVQAKEIAEEASRVKSQFLANMSHEIRTPMNGVMGMAEILQATELNQEQLRLAKTIQGSGEALLEIINDILDFSKLEAGRLELEAVDFNLQQLIEDVAQMLATRAHAKRLELAVLVEKGSNVHLNGDPCRLRQVLTNLIGNAIKFTDKGEVVVRASTMSAADDKEILRIAVCDTGIGISKESQARLFTPFTQADGSTTRKYGGTGLGLAISKQLVDLMGGELHCESQLGAGSTFYLTVELSCSRTMQQQIAATDSDILKGYRVLVIDDNATNRAIVANQTKMWGLRSDTAATGIEGLAKLRDAQEKGAAYDFVVLDMHMPDMNGLDVARTIQRDPLLAEVRMIMLTSVGLRGDARMARESGISAYLTKPVRQTELQATFIKVLGLSRSEEAKSIVTKYTIVEALPQFDVDILVAEDNLTNQEVAMAMLRTFSCRVDVVENGKMVLGTLDERPYDLVLMDCQMPEMDGYEATKAIRAMENEAEGKARTPIVALTAHALEGDRERCLAAGMDGYISKPFKQHHLQKMLLRFCRDKLLHPESYLDEDRTGEEDRRKVLPDDLAMDSRNHEERLEPIDRSVLADLQKLQVEGEPSIVRQVVNAYLQGSKHLLASLVDHHEQRSAEELRIVAHTLKSSSANVGAHRLSDMCKRLELRCEKGVLEDAGSLIGAIEEEFDQVREVLSQESITV